MPSRSPGKPRLGAALALATSGASVVIRAACTAVAIVQVFAEVLPLAILDVVAPVKDSSPGRGRSEGSADRKQAGVAIGNDPALPGPVPSACVRGGEVMHEVDAEDLRAHRAWN